MDIFICMRKKCRTCKITKDVNEFGIRRKNLDGFDNQCKQCQREYQKKYIQGYRAKQDGDRTVDTSHIDLTGIRKNEWCQAYRILAILGYKPELDIHTQFIEKHPYLTLKSRPTRNIKWFTWQDCK